GLAARLGAEDFDDAAARQAAPAEGNVEAERPGGNALHVERRAFAQLHDRAFAELFLDLRQGALQIPVVRLVGHVSSSLTVTSIGTGLKVVRFTFVSLPF